MVSIRKKEILVTEKTRRLGGHALEKGCVGGEGK